MTVQDPPGSGTIIISGKLYVDEQRRDQCVAGHLKIVEQARRQPGCIDLVIAADPLETDRINNFEHWESERDLAEWRKVAKPPKFAFDKKRSAMQKHRISESGGPF